MLRSIHLVGTFLKIIALGTNPILSEIQAIVLYPLSSVVRKRNEAVVSSDYELVILTTSQLEELVFAKTRSDQTKIILIRFRTIECSYLLIEYLIYILKL